MKNKVTTNLFALLVSSLKTSRNNICFDVFLQKTKERLFEKSVECKDDVINSIRHSTSRMTQLLSIPSFPSFSLSRQITVLCQSQLSQFSHLSEFLQFEDLKPVQGFPAFRLLHSQLSQLSGFSIPSYLSFEIPVFWEIWENPCYSQFSQFHSRLFSYGKKLLILKCENLNVEPINL